MHIESIIQITIQPRIEIRGSDFQYAFIAHICVKLMISQTEVVATEIVISGVALGFQINGAKRYATS